MSTRSVHLALLTAFALVLVGVFVMWLRFRDQSSTTIAAVMTIQLPQVRYASTTSVEEALLKRRSVREYQDRPLSLIEVGQLLWAAQGITDPERGHRTAPSAGALYPLELYLAVGNVEDLAPGVYHYRPEEHDLVLTMTGDVGHLLSSAALEQESVRDAACAIVLAAVYERTTQKYGSRGERYVQMEAGHAAQNVYLQAAALDLGVVVIGAFQDDEVRQLLDLRPDEAPLYLMPVGRSGE